MITPTYLVLLILFLIIAILEIGLIVRRISIFSILFLMPTLNTFNRVISLIYLDSGAYNTELQLYTTNAYAAPKYVAYLDIFLFFTYIFISFISNSLDYYKKNYIASYKFDIRLNLIYAAGFLALIYLAFDLIISGIPIFTNGVATRFNYWTDYSRLPGASICSLFLTPLAIAVGFSLAPQNISIRRKILGISIILFALLERFSLGYKSSGFTDILIGFLVGYIFRKYAIKKISARSVRKMVALGIPIFLLLAGVYLFSQIISQSDSLNQSWNSTLERIFALSGHMEWSVFNDPRSSAIGINDMSELTSIFSGKDEMDPGIGIYGLMAEYAPTAIYNGYLADGVRFAAGFISVSLFYNGIGITLVIIVINALIFSIFYYVFRKLSITNHILTFALLYRVFSIYASYVHATGTLTSIIRPNTFLWISICVVLWIAENSLQENYRNRIAASNISVI